MSKKQRAEATDAPSPPAGKSVAWRGEVFDLPTPEEFPLDALEAEEDGKPLTALRLILGEQYPRWRSLARTGADVQQFSEAVTAALGLGNR
ncbi:hypothetical protein NLX83_13730 [Allokutzneria sp. A3M-2-11 16]|uniref:hypothetical protein n=1 Tax=Allokutzneria sp. A3M-2-11 16 TaxID=2962043 RepID=UPI0020B6E84B|nr:hypothetical protein [Allokutzneria sp. A3M-2-11 16]MCP3800319.1 hypothetical protein [Allokutzneria sp. A3M-2-11 16]